MNDQDGDEHNHDERYAHALVCNVDDGDKQCDMSILGSGGDANSNDPNTYDMLHNGMDATILANNPNSKVNANIPTKGPKTNRKYMVYKYIPAQLYNSAHIYTHPLLLVLSRIE